MASSAKSSATVSGGKSAAAGHIGNVRSNRAVSCLTASTSKISLQQQAQIPTKGVSSKQVETVTTGGTQNSGNAQGRDASFRVPGGTSHCNPGGAKESKTGLTKQSVRPDRSKAFAQKSASPSGSHLTWVPLDVNESKDLNSTARCDFDSHLWRNGPTDTSGVVLDLSDRPLLCMSVRGGTAAIGCSDHSVYVVDVASQKLQRNLYGKKYGHVDWVTCVDFLQDGRIISGGMDNMLCLWSATGVQCTTLAGHSASISGVKVIDGNYGISASYDKTLMLWDLNRPQSSRPAGCLQGHKGAVLEFAVSVEGGIASGSREGEVFLWDGRDGKAVLKCKNAHDGHVTAVEYFGDSSTNTADSFFLSGGQDGVLQAWDKRVKAPVNTLVLSRSVKGKGAITNIAITSLSPGVSPVVAAASADKIIRILEPRSSFQTLHVIHDHTDFIYSLYTCGSLMWSGSGNGNLLIHDLTNGKCLYGLGATRNGAPRCVSLTRSHMLVVAGDDGNCIMYSI